MLARDILFVTLSVQSLSNQLYDDMLECWVKQMKVVYQKPNVAVIMTHYNLKQIKICQTYNVTIIFKPPVKTKTSSKKYQWLGSKLHLFKLLYKRVVYFDMDFVFNADPQMCEPLCYSDLCAVEDRYWLTGKQKGYINAGMIILNPSLEKYSRFKRALKVAPASNFAEQDVINSQFQFQLLPKKCNVIGPTFSDFKKNGLFHEKKNLVPTQFWPQVCK